MGYQKINCLFKFKMNNLNYNGAFVNLDEAHKELNKAWYIRYFEYYYENYINYYLEKLYQYLDLNSFY